MHLASLRKPRVYVDGKIVGRHSPDLLKKAYVAYFVEGQRMKGFMKVKAEETDDVELEAILFAINELKFRFRRFTIICDHQSVVSEINRQTTRRVKNPLLDRIRKIREENPGIEISEMERNLADKYLDELENDDKLDQD